MEATSKGKTTFLLTDQGQQLGDLVYESFFSLKAAITLANDEKYKIKPVGVFGTSISITKDTTEIASLKMNWRGQIVLSFQSGKEYIFRAKGVFINKYIIEDPEGEIFLQLDPKFEWRKFNYNYDIEYNKNPQDILFILLGIYAANYYMATMSGIIAGGA